MTPIDALVVLALLVALGFVILIIVRIAGFLQSRLVRRANAPSSRLYWSIFRKHQLPTFLKGVLIGAIFYIAIVTYACGGKIDQVGWDRYLTADGQADYFHAAVVSLAFWSFMGLIVALSIRTWNWVDHETHVTYTAGVHWLLTPFRWLIAGKQTQRSQPQPARSPVGRNFTSYQDVWASLGMRASSPTPPPPSFVARLRRTIASTFHGLWRLITWPFRICWRVITWPFRVLWELIAWICTPLTRLLSKSKSQHPVGAGDGHRDPLIEEPKARLQQTEAMTATPSRSGSKSVSLERRRPAALDTTQASVFWGMVEMPIAASTTHFLVAGTTGSGKTITIRLMMQSVFRWDRRALIYDAKRDVISFLSKLRPSVQWHTLNPFDERCVAWDIAADVNSHAAALQVASILIPARENETQPFFRDGARHLLYGVMRGLNANAPNAWTLRQALLVMKNQGRLIRLLEQTQSGQDIAETYASDKRVFLNILTTASTLLLPLEIVAALWDKQDRVSLTDWLNSDSILIMAQHPAYRAALTPINQAIFRRASDLTLSRPETADRTWFFLDEVRDAGRLDGLPALLNQGRSKGASVVLGFQDIEGMRAAYGEKEAHEIVGLCSNKTFLRTDSQLTAKWVEEHFGKTLRYERRVSHTNGFSSTSGPYGTTSSSSTSVHYERIVDDAVWASTLMSWPKTCEEHGLRGLHDMPCLNACYGTHIALRCIRERLPQDSPDPRADAALNEQFRGSAKEQELEDWTQGDEKALSRQPPPPQSATKTPAQVMQEDSRPSGIEGVRP